MKTKTKVLIITIVSLFAVGMVVYGYYNQPVQTEPSVQEQVDYVEELKRQRIQEIKQSPEFQEFINKELERRYYEEIKNNAIDELKRIEGSEEYIQDKSAKALREFLEGKNPELAQHAEYIVTLPRWVEAVAITSKETSFCNAGVGASRHNCGAIKNSKTGQFKYYRNKLESIEDITILLQKPLYKDLSIEQMNGIYCQDASRPGRKCADWDTHIVTIMKQIEQLIYS